MDKNISISNMILVSVLGMIVILFSNGLTISGITAFDEALLTEFNWTKSELKFRDFINLVIAAALVPFVGALIDRFGVKRVMSFGLILLTILYYSYSFIENSIQMYFLHAGFAIAVACAGTMSVVIMVSQRVFNHRGTALGIALAGTSLGGYTISKLSVYLLENYGWRTSFQYEAALPVIALILLWLFIKPVNYQKEDKDTDTGLNEIKFAQALRSKTYWAICAAGFFCFYSILGIIGNTFLYLTELGFDLKTAGNMFGTMFLIILFAKFISGILTDYISKFILFKLQLVCMLVGALLMASNTSSLAWPAIIAVGIGWGGLYTLFNYTIITTFGVKNAGKINGLISTFEAVGGGLGIWLTGYISDKTGDYSMSFYVVVVFLFISLLISFFIKPVVPDEN